MKKIAILLVVIIMTSSIPCFASTYSVRYMDYAVRLKEIGVFKGSDTGFELDREPTRLEAGVLFVRLLGAEKEALSKKYQHPFNDVPEWGNDYVGYLYHEKLTNGTSAAAFGSTDFINAKSYMTFILRALGYSDAIGDFTWDKSIEFAVKESLITELDLKSLKSEAFLRDHVAKYSYTALNMPLKNNTSTLINKLIEIGAINENALDTIKEEVRDDQITAVLSEWECYDTSKYSYFNIGYFNGYFYLMEDFQKKLYKSSDGITWSFVGIMNQNPHFSDVKYINGEYITRWDKYSFLTSSDLITWKEVNMYRSTADSSFTDFDLHGGYIGDFTYGKGKYVAVGSIDNVGGALVLTSEDFYNWKVRDFKKITDRRLEKVMFINDTFFASGNGLYKSNDGENWIKLTDISISDLLYAKGMFWGIVEDTLMKSMDGKNWTKVSLDFNAVNEANEINITYGGGVLMLFINSSFNKSLTFLTSLNGEKWTANTLEIPDGNALNQPIYGNGIFISNTSFNLFSGKEKNSQIYYSKVINPETEEANRDMDENTNKIQENRSENLVLMEDSLSLIFNAETITRLQSYPYYNGVPSYDFKYMERSRMRAEHIVEDFYRDIAVFKENEIFLTRRDLTYVTGELSQAIRGILQVKSSDGSITEQDMEYIFKEGRVNNSKPGGVDYELVAKRLLGDKRIKR
ncbi:MAG: exported protein of unknown function [Clostridia bacterium]|jgi:hypothetical protein|nr:exported protein of unknown function [Clostridia bacterium]